MDAGSCDIWRLRGLLAGVWWGFRAAGGGDSYPHTRAVRGPVDSWSGHVWKVVVVVVGHGSDFTQGGRQGVQVVLVLVVLALVVMMVLGLAFTKRGRQVVQRVQVAAALALVHLKARGLAEQPHAHSKASTLCPTFALHGTPPSQGELLKAAPSRPTASCRRRCLMVMLVVGVRARSTPRRPRRPPAWLTLLVVVLALL